MEPNDRIIYSLEGFLRRLSMNKKYAETWILRGSLVMRQWSKNRVVKDIDFYILQEDNFIFDSDEIKNIIKEILLSVTMDNLIMEDIDYQVTWFDEVNGGHKGIRITLKVSHSVEKWSEIIIIDLGLDDPLSDDNPWIDYKTLNGDILMIRSSPPIVALAWKLQLLLKGNWRAKDVADIYVLTDFMKNTINEIDLQHAVIRIFKFRNQSIDKLQLLLKRKMGHSRQARIKWKNFLSESTVEWKLMLPGAIRETFNIIADRLSPSLNSLII